MIAVHELTLLIYRVTEEFPEHERPRLGAHMRRAVLALAETPTRAHAAELASLLELARELGHLGPRATEAILAALTSVAVRQRPSSSAPLIGSQAE